MSEAIAFTLLGLLFLALGGDSLVKGAAGLAQGLRIPRFTIGLCLVAVATSLPELAVNARAVASGDRALALGNAVGSNIANIGLTLGLAALAAPLLLRWRALSPLLAVLLLATLGVAVLSLDGGLSRIEGLAMLLVFAGVVAFTAMRADDESPAVRAEVDAFTDTRGGLGLNLVRVAVAVVLLWFGAGWIVAQMPVIGHALGMDSLVAGLVLVAIGTALPEVAAAVAAARRGQGDIVAGHVIGSSVFNLLLVLGGMAAVGGTVPVPASFVRLELPVAFLFALLLVPLLRGNITVSRGEGGLLLAAFAAWVVLEFALLG
ncbi:sodium:calcium antiporter [Luteimonas sp. Sa2BVA3]|uniref:Sodium:calcium antiporter n=1 Tax=Luteimonas colneyensis TaxID=2762230 RepID=A0ABR8UJ99_9GAMM|nr:sodium:calcium antiporter [Luteimonas colneyensis]MBD7988102.1 sodium:calcium antiporter [Luteimonas colneyensis]